MDVITYLCFGQSGNAVDEPDFHDPLIEAMHNSTALVPVFFHFKIIRKLIMGMPPEMAKKSAPETAGLINMQVVRIYRILRTLPCNTLCGIALKESPIAPQEANRPACQRPGNPADLATQDNDLPHPTRPQIA